MTSLIKVVLISVEIFGLSLICLYLIVQFNLRRNSLNKNKKFCAYENYQIMENLTRDSFYIHLLSNVKSPQSHRNNTVSNFVTKLSEKMILSSEWEVGLAEMSYTKSWFNIRQDYDISVFQTSNGSLEAYHHEEAILRKGNYHSIELVVEEINKRMKVYESSSFKNDIKRSPVLRYDQISNRIYVTNGMTRRIDAFVYPEFPSELELILGMRDETNTSFTSFFYDEKNQKAIPIELVKLNYRISYENSSETQFNRLELEAPFPVQFNVSELHLLVYCSIVQPVMIGNIQTNLLRQVEIPKDSKFGEQCVLRFNEPFYYPIVSHEFDTIEIDIKDDVGENIPFDFGRSTVTLHFRKRPKDEFETIRRLLR
jgi:hypothetical protein